MSRQACKAMLIYGLLAAAVLGCLHLISLAPLKLSWGRELVGAAIAVVALLLGLRLAQRERVSAVAATPEVQSEQLLPESIALAPPSEELSPRERQVLLLLAEGHSNKGMARALSVSENTIKTHLSKLYAKLKVNSRTEALAIARRNGLLPPG